MMKASSSSSTSSSPLPTKSSKAGTMLPLRQQPRLRPSTPLTPALVQQYLDENQLLIQAIVDHQNSGNLDECSKYQQRLLDNLIYLATIADLE